MPSFSIQPRIIADHQKKDPAAIVMLTHANSGAFMELKSKDAIFTMVKMATGTLHYTSAKELTGSQVAVVTKERINGVNHLVIMFKTLDGKVTAQVRLVLARQKHGAETGMQLCVGIPVALSVLVSNKRFDAVKQDAFGGNWSNAQVADTALPNQSQVGENAQASREVTVRQTDQQPLKDQKHHNSETNVRDDQDSEDNKGNEDGKDNKDNKDGKDGKDNKDNKGDEDSKDNKDSKD
ncbi:hypothetical protein RHS03_07936, partial [Rhizoctonia solani]